MKRSVNQNISLICLGTILMWIGFDPSLTPWGDSSPFFHIMAHVVAFAGATLFAFGIECTRRMVFSLHRH